MGARSVLVTGGAGFIGSNVAAHFAEAGDAVTVCDQFGRTERWRNLLSAHLHDLILPSRMPALLAARRFDLVVHLGAVSDTTERDVDLIVRSNVELSLSLLEHCAGTQVPFLYASSAAVYGDGSAGFDDEASREALSRLRPLNAYGWSKLVVDRAMTARRDAGEPMPPQWAGLRFFNVFGPNEAHKGEMRSVVHKVFGQIRSGEPVTLFRSARPDIPDGGQRRDFIHVADCVAAIDWLSRHPEVSGLFNLGTGRARPFLDLARAVFAALGRPAEIHFVDMPEALRGRYQYFTQAPMGRLREAGYAREFLSLEEGVARYVERLLQEDGKA